MAYLWKYYEYKTVGAVELHKYRLLTMNENENRIVAFEQLTLVDIYWEKYADLAKQSYKNPLWLNRVGYVDFDKIYGRVMDDISIVKEGINKETGK